jgi:hypothetical protein
MKKAPDPYRPLPQAAEVERPLQAVEDRLRELGAALSQHDSLRVDREAALLHAALVLAVAPFSRATQGAGLPAPLRQRLAQAGGQVAAQREALARATASVDRALGVLMPSATPAAGLYGAAGNADRGGSSPFLLA